MAYTISHMGGITKGKRTDVTAQPSVALQNHRNSHTHKTSRTPLSPLTIPQVLSKTLALLCTQRTVHTFTLHEPSSYASLDPAKQRTKPDNLVFHDKLE